MTKPVSYKRHGSPPQIIAHAVWLYVRFPLSLRLVEEMLLERGIVVSYKRIRRWGRKFGPEYARRLRRKQPNFRDVWHLDEVVISIAGRKHWLWRAVDQGGYVLDEIVQNQRDTKAARRLLIRLMKKQGIAPTRIITDKLPSYAAARRQVLPRVEHRSHKGLNNRAENSHLPLRKRERMMQGFGLWEVCSGSPQSSRLAEICSFRLARPSLLSLPTSTAYKPWRHGKPRQTCSPEFNRAGLIAVSSG